MIFFQSRPRKFLLVIFCFCLGGLYSCSENKKETLFSLIKPEESGIQFSNKLADTDSLNILDYLYYYNGAGIAAGDINQDGLPDLYFASNTGSNKLYLNLGDFHFRDISLESGTADSTGWTTGVTFADVNLDGLVDIYVSKVTDHQVSSGARKGQTFFANTHNLLYINKGNLKFEEESELWGVNLKGYNTQAAFFDYDKDGDYDLFQLQHSVHQTDTYGDTSLRRKYSAISGAKLLRNDGNRFTDITLQSGIISSALGYGLGVTIGDFNNDGWEDIYVGNDFHESDYYYVNKGNGTFEEKNSSAFGHQSYFSMGNDAADLNNDGWLDIFTLDMLPQDEKVLKSSAGDQVYDVYANQRAQGYSYQYARNCLQLNTGSGERFSEIALYSGVAATDWSWAALMADYDLDGFADIFITNGIKRRLNDLDYIQFLSASGIGPGARAGDEELIKRMPEGSWHNYIYKGSDSLVFSDRSQEWGFGEFTLSNGAAYADLDNDGDLDLITNNINQSAGIYKNNTREQNPANFLNVEIRNQKGSPAIGAKLISYRSGIKQFFQVQGSRGFMSAVDPRINIGLGKDSVLDSMVIIYPDDRLKVLYNLKANQHLQVYPDSTTPFEYKNLDHYGIQKPGTIFRNITSQSGVHFRHRENISFVDFNRQWFIPRMISTMGPKLAIADVNNDGLEDFFVCGAKQQPGQLFVQTPSGTFTPSHQPAIAADSASEDTGVLLADLNGDGFPDLYLVSGGNEYFGTMNQLKDRLYINDGKGAYVKSNSLPDLFENKSVVCAADFDGDGDPDLFVGGRADSRNYGEDPRSWLLLNDGSGNFSIAPEEVAPGLSRIGMVTDACWTDLNRDGKMDLVIAGDWMAPAYFINRDGTLIKENGTKELSGLWSSLLATDLNNDGYDDLLLGNYGINSKLNANREFPLKLYLADPDKNNHTDLLLAVPKNKNYYTFHGREHLEKQ